MVATICPMVHGLRHNGSALWAFWFVAAHVVGACITAVIITQAGILVNQSIPLTAVLVMSIATLGAFRELGIVCLPLPSTRWQVPRRWSLLSAEVMARRYGFFLGLALTTRVTNVTIYIGMAICAISRDFAFSIVCMATYGLARSLPVLAVIAYSEKTPSMLGVIHKIGGYGSHVRVVNAAALSILAIHFALYTAYH